MIDGHIEAGAQCLERCLQPFHRILVRSASKFVVDAGNIENHANITSDYI